MSDYVDTIDIEGTQYDIQDTQTKQQTEENTQDVSDLATGVTNLQTEMGKRPIQLCFNNITVQSSDWINQGSSPDVTGFPFRAEITTLDTTTDFSPDVRFDVQSATSGILAPVARCEANKVYIYASEQPDFSVNISTIVCIKAV